VTFLRETCVGRVIAALILLWWTARPFQRVQVRLAPGAEALRIGGFDRGPWWACAWGDRLTPFYGRPLTTRARWLRVGPVVLVERRWR
jgi:hypothetical protein